MKARVKATGEIVEVELNHIGCTPVYIDKNRVIYKGLHDLDFEVEEEFLPKDEPDYWEKLRHQYAGMAMQGILSNNELYRAISKSRNLETTIMEYATDLVNRLKEESQCEK